MVTPGARIIAVRAMRLDIDLTQRRVDGKHRRTCRLEQHQGNEQGVEETAHARNIARRHGRSVTSGPEGGKAYCRCSCWRFRVSPQCGQCAVLR